MRTITAICLLLLAACERPPGPSVRVHADGSVTCQAPEQLELTYEACPQNPWTVICRHPAEHGGGQIVWRTQPTETAPVVPCLTKDYVFCVEACQ